MPTSYPCNIPLVVRIMENANPKKVLDVGPGYGKYGFLFRERVDDFRWRRRIDGIDPFDDYMDRSQCRHLYNNFYRGLFPHVTHYEAGRVWHRWPTPVRMDDPVVIKYDLVLMVDVLEHYLEADGYDALRAALKISPKVLISTPIGYPQGESHGNPHERHVSDWPVEKIESASGGRFEDLSGGFDGVPGAVPGCVVGVLHRG